MEHKITLIDITTSKIIVLFIVKAILFILF